jgi:2-oxoglutarate ferredoxin oxidoreductase subunit alpha
MKGNEALCEAAIRAGCEAYFGYPITPQNEVAEYMSRRMLEEGRQFVQTESEIATINMVFGAACAGARVMTSSSSPGISLMQEGISYIAATEVPCVIVNIMRGGPGLGNIAPSQADYLQATKGGGHGDYNVLVYGPINVQELSEIVYKSFDKADKWRSPVIVLGDGILGQMMETVDFTDMPIQKNDLKSKEPWATIGCKSRDPNLLYSLIIVPEEMEVYNWKLQEKYAKMEAAEQVWQEKDCDEAELVVVAYGIVARIAKTVIGKLREEGKKVALFRPISLWPFPWDRLGELAKDKKRKFLVMEMAFEQLAQDVWLGVGDRHRVEGFYKLGGVLFSPPEVEEKINSMLS